MQYISIFTFALVFFLVTIQHPEPVRAEQPASPATDSARKGAPASASPKANARPRNASKKPAQKAKKRRSPAKRRKRRCATAVRPNYQRMLRRVRRTPKSVKLRYREGFRSLTVYAVNKGERVTVFPYLPDGTLDPEAMAELAHLLRDKRTDAEHPLEPRLVALLYRVADRFKARQIVVISGYREGKTAKSESNHGKGRAVDFLLPGVKLANLVYYARTLGHVGVGFYPNSGFVHLDVRRGPSVFWVDRSGPGKPSCYVRVLKKQARKMDRRYRKKHDRPKRHRTKRGKLRGALPPVSDPPPTPPRKSDPPETAPPSSAAPDEKPVAG